MIRQCKGCAGSTTSAAVFQNKTYGEGMRVYNPCGGKNKGKFRCSICETDFGSPGASVAKPKEAK
jgi:hypothetical protein